MWYLSTCFADILMLSVIIVELTKSGALQELNVGIWILLLLCKIVIDIDEIDDRYTDKQIGR